MRYLGALVLLLAGCGGHQSPPLTKALDGIVAGGVPGALIVVRDGERVRSAAAGVADVDASSRLQAGDRFRIGSVTKTFVATAVLQLVEENQLRLDEPIARLFPRLLPDGERITIRDLLAHRSGLADVADNPEVLEGRRSDWSPQTLVRWASQQPRTSVPGSAFHYSSTNYLLLGLVVERVTHQSLSMVLAHRIIAPLGLSNTSFEPAVITGPHVHGYQFPSHQGIVDPHAEPRDLERRSVRWAGAAGDLVSSAADLTHFFAALQRGELLAPQQLRAMDAIRDNYGLGIATYPTRCGRALGHTGSLNGIVTVAWTTFDGRRQVVVMANAYPLTAAAADAVRRTAVAAFCDH